MGLARDDLPGNLFALCMAILSQNAKGEFVQHGTIAILLVPALIGLLFLVLLEIPTAWRTVILTDNEIGAMSPFTMFADQFRLR